MSIKVLDCTLRDGGYVNEWNFGEFNIKRIITHLRDAEIEIIECGFLSNRRTYDPNVSIFESVEQFTGVIPFNRGKSTYVCMINYGEYEAEDIPTFDGSSVDGIRVAFHKKDIPGAIDFCTKIAQKGYQIFIQPMVTINYSDIELLELVKAVNEINPVGFYIVDSFGVMKKNDLLRMFYLVDNNLNSNINIGYHSHNNLQLAYSNAQALVDVKSKRTRVIDSSVFGMGRGAGNLNTELFVQYLNETSEGTYYVYPLLQIIDETLNKIYSINYWGYSLPHYLSSTCNCHPNYASYLSDKNTLTVKSISEVLSKIPKENRVNFDKKCVEELYLSYQKHYIDDTDAVKVLSGNFYEKNIVVIAPGSSIEEYGQEIAGVINQEETIAISVNFLPEKFKCNYCFVSNNKRFETIVESGKLSSKEVEVILTSNISPNNVDFIQVNYNDLLNETQAVRDNAMLMLLKLLTTLNVKKVFLAGFDGYSYDNTQNYADKNMIINTSNKVITDLNLGISEVLTELTKKLDMNFITPSLYSI